MTAPEVAERLPARQTGPDRWLARCPAHEDRSPSLSIAGGADGRVLLHCFFGCATSAVLAALGLAWADVCGVPATPTDRARMRRDREQRESAEAEQRQRQRELVDLLRNSDTVLDALAAKRALEPGEGGDLYDVLLDAQRKAEGVDPWA